MLQKTPRINSCGQLSLNVSQELDSSAFAQDLGSSRVMLAGA